MNATSVGNAVQGLDLSIKPARNLKEGIRVSSGLRVPNAELVSSNVTQKRYGSAKDGGSPKSQPSTLKCGKTVRYPV